LLKEASEIQLLRELDRLRSDLVANVSHELRTPLGLIKIFCTTLMRQDIDLDRATQLEFLQDIGQETDRLEEIVTNLLDVSHLESGRLRLEKAPTDLTTLLADVVKEMSGQSARHHLRCSLSRPLIVSVDRRRLMQVLRNLLSNAIKYSPSGGEVAVHARQEQAQAVISIVDQGIGIPEPEQRAIFERFYRADNETTRSVSGVGLGLSVCQGIVEAHGGRIWVESEPGQGSTFSFTLPVGAVSEVQVERLDAPSQG
jgi:signal transduction histidine kinase